MQQASVHLRVDHRIFKFVRDESSRPHHTKTIPVTTYVDAIVGPVGSQYTLQHVVCVWVSIQDAQFLMSNSSGGPVSSVSRISIVGT